LSEALIWLREIGLSGLLDIAVMSLLIYTVLLWTRRSRAAWVLTGILIIGAVYLLARQFGLELTAAIFEKFFAVILIALVVIFQGELRSFFEQLALWSLRRRWRSAPDAPQHAQATLLASVAFELARGRVGAIVVLQGRQPLGAHLNGGAALDGALSEPLLYSIFDPHSAGHDGAVIVSGEQVSRFGVHLPLSKNEAALKRGGTRHAAALGLSEVTDALCLVVSEERGEVSIARNGELRPVADLDTLVAALERFYEEVSPPPERRRLSRRLRSNWRLKLGSVGMAAVLWLVVVYGGRPTYRSFTVPVQLAPPDAPFAVSEVEPAEVAVTLRGPFTAFFFVNKERVRVLLSAKPRAGAQRLPVTADALDYPKDLVLEGIAPQVVTVKLKRR